MFNRKKSKYPDFRILNTFYKRSFYFLKNAEWSWLDEESILVTEPHKLDVITLTGWPRFIFLSATGDKTVEEFVYSVADQFAEAIPGTLDKVLVHELLELESKKIILLTNKKQMLPIEFDLPGLKG